jgi:hypothetical protein
VGSLNVRFWRNIAIAPVTLGFELPPDFLGALGVSAVNKFFTREEPAALTPSR